MSAEKLREAARLMRENANAAICPCGGPMCNVEKGWFHEGELRARLEDTPGDSVPHVLAWSPVVALAAALGMECTAEALEARGVCARLKPAERAWIDFARAYLGEQS